jgi:ankyrin repeat protein
MANILLIKGAQANIRDVHRQTPLHAAAVKEHQNLIDLLLGVTDKGQIVLQ